MIEHQRVRWMVRDIGGTMNVPGSFGYFDAPDQTEPAQMPDPAAPCLLCGQAIGPRGRTRGSDGKSELVTTSIMPIGGERSYFYDVHRGCYENATPDQITDIESMVIDGVQ
jgi:hypothetical protein